MGYEYHLADAAARLRSRCEHRADFLYGEAPPEAVKDRLTFELETIIEMGYSTQYEIAADIADEVHRLGQRVTTRGMLSSSFVSWLCGVSAVNPLPAHYLCAKCSHFEPAYDRNDHHIHGFDLPNKRCPVCGDTMRPDGADILPEVLMGIEFNREPAVYLNVSPEIRKTVVDYLKVKLSDAMLLRAGISGKEMNGKPLESVHPGKIYYIPKDLDISGVTGLRESENDDDFNLPITIHDYSEFYGVFSSCDIYSFPALGLLCDMEESTGILQTDIPMNDGDVLEVFRRDGFETFLPLDGTTTYGLKEIRLAQPACFSDLVQISGLVHGTGTWDKETEKALLDGKRPRNLIAYRDDVYRYLMNVGIDRKTAFRIMDRIRKGRGLTEVEEQMLNERSIPSCFIERCNRIQYVFPKSHGVESVTLSWKLAWYKLHYPELYARNAERFRK